MLVGCAVAQLCGCLPLTIASAIGMASGGTSGPSAKGTNTAPFRENQWIKDKGPELYQATEAAVLEECTRQLETVAPAADDPGEDRATPSCAYRKSCLPGNRVPVDLLVCGPDGRPSSRHSDASGGVAQVPSWEWEKVSSAEPRPGED